METTTLSHLLETTPAEEVSQGIRVKWVLDRRLLYVIGDSSQRADIDAWFEFMTHVIQDWPSRYTYLAVQDLSSPKFALTPYARARASEIYKVRPSLTGRVAIILPRTFVGHMLRLFIRGEKRNHFETQFFMTQHDALAWLAEKLPDEVAAGTH